MSDQQYQGLIAMMYSQSDVIVSTQNVVVHWIAGACVLLAVVIFCVGARMFRGA